jgi:DNA-binding GntR family transcriptional regulator
LTQETYEILLDAICTREFLPGERLNQDEIAARLKVSRQPVNSAIAILKSDKLVEETGRRGVVVSALDPELLTSIHEYRLTIEPFAAGLAAARGNVPGRGVNCSPAGR